jgi:cobalt-zinc-cadmium efflux system membrane fusion protein
MKNTIFLAALVLLALNGCGSPENPQENTAEAQTPTANPTVSLSDEQLKLAQLTIGRATEKNIGAAITVNGTVDLPVQNTAAVCFPLGGYLKSTRLSVGAPVKKGEVLAVLEDPQYIQLQEDFLTAKTEVQLLQSELARQEELNKTKATSDKTLQQTAAELNKKNIALKALEQKLLLLGLDPRQLSEQNISGSVQLRSPFDGYVSAVKVSPGRYVAPTDVLFELVNPSDLQLQLKVFEKDLSGVRIGQTVTAFTNNQPEKKYRATVLFHNRRINEDRSLDVVCRVDERAPELIPGMFVNAEVKSPDHLSVVVPEIAVVRHANRQYVFVARSEKTFERVEVQLGIVQNGEAELIGASAAALLPQNLVLGNAYKLLMALENKAEE